MIRRALRHTFSLLNIDYVKLGNKWNYKGIMSPYYRLYYIDGGYGEISSAGTTLTLEPGFLYLIPSFTLCDLKCDHHLSQYFIQFFEESTDGVSLFANNRAIYKISAEELDVANFKQLLLINPGRGINRSDNPKIYEKKVFYEEYQELNNQQSLSNYVETHGLLLYLVSRFLTPDLFKPKKFQHMPVKIHDAISYIMLNLEKKLTVSSLAERANQNTDYFSRNFQHIVGDRPLDYIQSKRIEKAQYLIVTTQLTYSEIAQVTGFDNVSYLSKTFKRLTGMSPRKYRNQSDSMNS